MPPPRNDPPLDFVPPRYLPDPNTYEHERYQEVFIDPDPRYSPMIEHVRQLVRTWVKTTVDGKKHWELEKRDTRSVTTYRRNRPIKEV